MARAATAFEKLVMQELAELRERIKRLEQGETILMANQAAVDKAITDLENKIKANTGVDFTPEITRLRTLTTAATTETAAATAADPGTGTPPPATGG